MAYIIDRDFQQGLKFQPDDNFPSVHFYNIDYKNKNVELLVTFHEEMLRLLGSESIPGNTLIPRTLLSIADMFGIG
jgi:hypothetical protein